MKGGEHDTTVRSGRSDAGSEDAVCALWILQPAVHSVFHAASAVGSEERPSNVVAFAFGSRARVIQAGSRERFLDEVLRFVRSAATLPGVLRIALIGSILTDRPDPKDVDVLVSVTGRRRACTPGRIGATTPGSSPEPEPRCGRILG